LFVFWILVIFAVVVIGFIIAGTIGDKIFHTGKRIVNVFTEEETGEKEKEVNE